MSNQPSPITLDRDGLRRQLRERRRTLDIDQRLREEFSVEQKLRALPAIRRARHIAVYLAIDGELSLTKFIAGAENRNHQLYAPVLNGNDLSFGSLNSKTPLNENCFGIPEPSAGPYIDARSLDLVLTPLVGFDKRGVRLGMGGGYYDHCFHFLSSRTTWHKPKLIGVGFDFQFLNRIESHSWDVRLWSAITATSSYSF